MVTAGAVLSTMMSVSTEEYVVVNSRVAATRRSYEPSAMPVVDQEHEYGAARFQQRGTFFQSLLPATAYSNRMLYRPSGLVFCSVALRGTVPRSASPGSARVTPKAL